MRNLCVIFDRRPDGAPRADDFHVEAREMPAEQDGTVLLQTLYLSIDPYMLLQMQAKGRYAGLAPGSPMHGRAVSRVLRSRSDAFKVGDHVIGYADWAEYNAAKPADLYKLDASRIPLPAFLGAVGHSGITAWAGICDVARPQPGETVVVSAASGAVGSVAGQIARIRGCRVVGIAGGPDKVRCVTGELGFDACIDYKQHGWVERLYAAVPDGIDVCFENVGGAILDAVLARLNQRARIALCGLVAQYVGGQAFSFQNFNALLSNAVTLKGFRVSDYLDRRDAILGELSGWVLDGRLSHREHIVSGIENAPAAFVAMLAGDKLGKQVVQVCHPAA